MDGASSAPGDRRIFTHQEWRQIVWLLNPVAEEVDRWQGTADSDEYLVLVIYLTQRDKSA